ncbi:MAG: hypothetical protein GY765_09600 [bacterium]|nr:hypothetical protein [bacterium]
MTTQSYLDIYPSTGIARQFNVEELKTEASLRELIIDIDRFIKTVEQQNVKFLEARQAGEISSTDTFKFFRSQERTRNVRLILQYLVTFLTKLPLQTDIDTKMVNPFEQIKSFSRNSVNLLKDADVVEAILDEHKGLGLLNDTNSWYYKGQISKNHKQILRVVEGARFPIIAHYCRIFEALQRLCLFWFSVRSENIKRVRLSDLYIFKLTLILLDRYVPRPDE